MPANKYALIRYKTIDQCLRNRQRKWTLIDLIEACSDALYEYEGLDNGISKRSVQLDIQMMRSDKLGYNAPIVVVERKYYTYEDPQYSITNIPLTDQDLGRLTEAVTFLKQFQGFSHFRELDGMVQKLEDHVHARQMRQEPVIDFEKNENLKGLEYLDALYQAIIKKRAIQLTYQSFKARQADTFDFHPYLLKEFRNRWFVIGSRKQERALLNLALDRIQNLEASTRAYQPRQQFSAAEHFKHAIGVSVHPDVPPQKVLLYVNQRHAPYVLTKPLHWSQQLLDKDYYGITISLDVQHNFELEKEILGFGDGIKVIAPKRLKRIIEERLMAAVDLYQTEISDGGLKTATRMLMHKGYSILKQVYTRREVRKMGSLIKKWQEQHKDKSSRQTAAFSERTLLQKIPALRPILWNKNLQQIIRAIEPKAFLTKAIYFDKTPQTNWSVSWHQDIPINVKAKKATEGFSGWTQKEDTISVRPPDAINQNRFSVRIHIDETNQYNGALKLLPGSHKKCLMDKEIQTISQNAISIHCEVPAGGIQLMKPLLLHASSKSTSQKRRRVIHLEFASLELPGGLEWAEREGGLALDVSEKQ